MPGLEQMLRVDEALDRDLPGRAICIERLALNGWKERRAGPYRRRLGAINGACARIDRAPVAELSVFSLLQGKKQGKIGEFIAGHSNRPCVQTAA